MFFFTSKGPYNPFSSPRLLITRSLNPHTIKIQYDEHPLWKTVLVGFHSSCEASRLKLACARGHQSPIEASNNDSEEYYHCNSTDNNSTINLYFILINFSVQCKWYPLQSSTVNGDFSSSKFIAIIIVQLNPWDYFHYRVSEREMHAD